MKLTLKHSGIHHPIDRLRRLVQRAIDPLQPLRQIDEAKVRLTREENSSPPFRVHAQLVTPGPDVFAEARDHTLAAALGKVMKQLARVINGRRPPPVAQNPQGNAPGPGRASGREPGPLGLPPASRRATLDSPHYDF